MIQTIQLSGLQDELTHLSSKYSERTNEWMNIASAKTNQCRSHKGCDIIRLKKQHQTRTPLRIYMVAKKSSLTPLV